MKKDAQSTAHETAIEDAMTLISTLELPYLIELSARLGEHIEKRRKADITEARRRIEAIAQKVGMSVGELLQGAASGAKGTLPPMYADPTDPKRTWSGKGRKPFWMLALEDQGYTLDQLRIQQPEGEA
jgi:DNA-binding protein H-NS